MLQHLRNKPTTLPKLATEFLAKPLPARTRINWKGWLYPHGRWMYLIEVIGPHNPPGRADHHWFENDEVANAIDVSVVAEVKEIETVEVKAIEPGS